MKKYFLAILLIFIMSACTHFEATNEIHPKVTVVGNKIGLEYKLGNLTITDQFDDIDTSIYRYILEHKDTIRFTLKIVYDDSGNTVVFFQYYVNGVHVATNKDVVSKDLILMERENIPNFRCVEGDACKMSNPKSNGEVEEIKEKEKQVEIPPPIENKQLQKEKRL